MEINSFNGVVLEDQAHLLAEVEGAAQAEVLVAVPKSAIPAAPPHHPRSSELARRPGQPLLYTETQVPRRASSVLGPIGCRMKARSHS